MVRGGLQLVEARLQSVLPRNGAVAEASFALVARQGKGPEKAYKLTAMNSDSYEVWYLEMLVDEHLIAEEVPPLVVPDAVLATTGLAEHVQREFLDVTKPFRINAIAVHLIGPLDIAEGEGLKDRQAAPLLPRPRRPSSNVSKSTGIQA